MLRRSMTAIAVVAILSAACAGEALEETTRSTMLSSPTTLDATTTATTGVEEAVDICNRGKVWEPGTTYSADCFLVPVSFEPVDTGWRSQGVGVDRMLLTWIENEGADEPTAQVGVVAYRPADSASEVVDVIVDFVDVEAVSERTQVAVGGHRAVVIDIQHGESSRTQYEDPCFRIDAGLRLPGELPGERLTPEGLTTVGLGPCQVFRVWAVSATRGTVTIVAAFSDTDRFDELMPVVERLLDTMTFASS